MQPCANARDAQFLFRVSAHPGNRTSQALLWSGVSHVTEGSVSSLLMLVFLLFLLVHVRCTAGGAERSRAARPPAACEPRPAAPAAPSRCARGSLPQRRPASRNCTYREAVCRYRQVVMFLRNPKKIIKIYLNIFSAHFSIFMLRQVHSSEYYRVDFS